MRRFKFLPTAIAALAALLLRHNRAGAGAAAPRPSLPAPAAVSHRLAAGGDELGGRELAPAAVRLEEGMHAASGAPVSRDDEEAGIARDAEPVRERALRRARLGVHADLRQTSQVALHLRRGQ